MPVIRDIPLSLEISEVLRREGLGGYSKVRPEIKSLITELLAGVKKAHLLEPAVAYEIYSITEMSQSQVSLEGNLVLQCSLLSSLLPQAKELAIAVCTIGPRLEKQVTDYTNRGEPLRGILLDGIGSAAVDSLTQEVCKFITGEASSRGYQASSPISPGMPGLPITEQWQLLEMVPAREIGVSLTPLAIMSPRKSTSMVIGIGPQMTTWTQAEVCGRCNLRRTCPYKVIPRRGGVVKRTDQRL
ncbi:MAG: hypothetical protein KAV68_00675 [Dehalococcoidales bacterium]|nr:hypothetical protein [Dehalococcoidales bacterium]